MIFRHKLDRAKLQTRLVEQRDRQIAERTQLAKHIHDLKRDNTRQHTHDQPKKSKLARDFTRSVEKRDISIRDSAVTIRRLKGRKLE